MRGTWKALQANLLKTYSADAGGSQLVADGKIKLRNDGQIETFTETGLKFDNGSELLADVVVFATGYDTSLAYHSSS